VPSNVGNRDRRSISVENANAEKQYSCMRSGLGTPPPSRSKPLKVPVIFAPIYVPVFLIVGALSIPWTSIRKSVKSRQERRFAEQMRKVGRVMEWSEFKRAESIASGTVIGEWLSIKGPFRLWWTPDDIPKITPHKWNREKHVAWMDPGFLPFYQWCYARYTNPEAGVAQLVPVSKEERELLKAIIKNDRFVLIGRS
jgi:hypothetical protein